VKLWWLTNFARVAAEKTAVEKLAAEESWYSLTSWTVYENRFSVSAVITAHGVAYPVRLIYPDQFPQVPPWVERLSAVAAPGSYQIARAHLTTTA
jgi:hypothetical protein